MAVSERWFGGWQVRIRYFAQSLGGLVVGLGLLAVWVEICNIAPWLAALINFLVMGVVQCGIADRWVFPGDPATSVREFATRFVGYQAAMLSSKGLNYVIFVGLLAVNVWYPVAWIAGAGVSFTLSLALNRRIWATRTHA